jgi:hypothetical protein
MCRLRLASQLRGAGLETAAPKSFVEPAALGWLAASFSSEAVAPESGNGA